MAKLTIKLKQHTPLIHFEHGVDGATLRATELKPKLDKFLVENVFERNYKEYCNYLVGYDEKNDKHKEQGNLKPAFDYKVKIKVNKKNQVVQLDKFPLYFGDLEKDENDEKVKKYYVFNDGLIDLEFFSFKTEIINRIKDKLPEFLFNTNFGTRQSKGFGSFFINDELKYKLDEIDLVYLEKEVENIKKSKFSFKIENTDIKKIFINIETFYKSLRSGLNFNKENPFIEKYCRWKYKKEWDKQGVKEEYFGEARTGNKKLLIKDLFGLSTKEEWKNQNGMITKEHIDKEIERFKSPLFFKIFEIKKGEYIVYMKINDSYKDLLEKTFIIKNHSEGNLSLTFPSKFDFDDFFKFVLNSRYYNKKVEWIYKQIKAGDK